MLQYQSIFLLKSAGDITLLRIYNHIHADRSHSYPSIFNTKERSQFIVVVVIVGTRCIYSRSNGNGRRAVPSSSVSTAVSTPTSPRSPPSRRGNARNNGTRPRRRLQRGWWPDAQKRAERSFQAMQDLKDATFVSNKYQNSTVVVTRVVIIYLYRLIMCVFSTLYLCCICILFG